MITVNIRRIAVLVALACAVTAADAAAQIRLSVAGGPTMPLGALDDAVETGYNAQLSAALSVPLLPVGVRVDGMFNQFPEELEDGNFRVLSGTVNGILSLPMVGIVPYLIGGVGVYSSRFVHAEEEGADHAHEDEGSTTNIGANIGGGVRVSLPGLSVFGEVRLHNLFSKGDQVRFAPLSLGLRF